MGQNKPWCQEPPNLMSRALRILQRVCLRASNKNETHEPRLANKYRRSHSLENDFQTRIIFAIQTCSECHREAQPVGFMSNVHSSYTKFQRVLKNNCLRRYDSNVWNT
jgi:hypothetical protein